MIYRNKIQMRFQKVICFKRRKSSLFLLMTLTLKFQIQFLMILI